MTLSHLHPDVLDARRITQRRNLVISLVLGLTAPAFLLMADLHWRTGLDLWKIAHLALFTVLFSLIAFGATQALVGFALRRKGGDPFRITADPGFGDDTTVINTRIAVVMPICNEEVNRVMEGMRAIYESVAATGKLPECDFFFLSDSGDSNHWVAEEAAWLAITQQLAAHGRLFYRRRRAGINKKAGNVADFCRRWGRHYRYMVVLDADSIMSGDAIVRLVRLMESNRGVGIIQAVPLLANGETVFARLQQFASRLYGSVFATGLNFWQLSEANYWGHNAIIRVAPFTEHCSLPELPGDGPFGGRILSHDYVEAALMRRAGWQVWLATDLEGSYEECPANLIDFAKRDRRWLQGNLQHTRLIVARGFHVINRLHFTLGILSYLASPLWLVLIVLSAIIARNLTLTGAAGHAAAGLGGRLGLGYSAQGLLLFAFTMALLMLPKAIALLDLRARPNDVPGFGGWRRIAAGVVAETVIFTLIAPVLMLFHTKFVVLTLAGRNVSWGSQRRGRAGASALEETIAAHTSHTLIGLGAAIIAWRISPVLAVWMSPILAGLVLSIPVSYLTGSFELGLKMRARGLFQTPEETSPQTALVRLAERMGVRRRGALPQSVLQEHTGLLQDILDPYVNAVHVALLRAKEDPPPALEERLSDLRDRLMRDGPEALTPRERIALLMDIDSVNTLHHDIWSSSPDALAEWWQIALRHYAVIAPPPQTAFTPPGSDLPPAAVNGPSQAAA